MVATGFVALALATIPSLSLQEEVGTAVTIYNQGFALVKDTRALDLAAGRQELVIGNVSAAIEPSSVGIRSVTAPGSFEVLEQNYRYDLISTQTILAKAVGQRVSVRRTLPNGSRELVSGTLLSTPDNGFVLRNAQGAILLDPGGEIEVDSIPEGLISRPSLVWDLVAERAGSQRIEFSYLTGGTQWNADYVLDLDQTGKVGNLKGWVTLQNRSGVTFTDAKLKLLAGDVARVETEPAAPALEGGAKYRDKKAFVEEQFADYHLYTLGRPVTLRNQEQKQISLLEAPRIEVKPLLVLDAERNPQRPDLQEGQIEAESIRPLIRFEIKNSQANRLGMPLPKGPFKIFQRDASGALQMLGEDAIDHTPRDETLSIDVGRAFDVICQRRRTQFERLKSRAGTRETFEIVIRNHKSTPVTVTVIERHWGETQILRPSLPFQRTDTDTVVFEVPVKANGATTLTYTVETRW